MENNEITISIICRKDRVNAANEAPLYLRINKGQQKKLLSLKLQIPIMYWDFENNVFLDKCVNRNYYDLVIEEKKQEINKKIMAANLEGRVLSLGRRNPKRWRRRKKSM